MKKLIFTLLLINFILPGFSQVEEVAKDVLTAYKKRNADDLKKYASGIFKYAITDDYFSDKEIQSDLKYVDNWNGEIKEIRYKTGDVMGKTVTLASAYYADSPESGEICVVILSTTDRINWVMFAGGLSSESKSEFEKMSLSLNDSEGSSVKKSTKKFNIEMANGDTFENIEEKTIKDCVDKLNDDNFFVILSSGDDYMQAAYSDQGFTIQFSEDGKQLEAEAYLTKEQTIEIFNKYFNGNKWKEGNNWVEPSY